MKSLKDCRTLPNYTEVPIEHLYGGDVSCVLCDLNEAFSRDRYSLFENMKVLSALEDLLDG